MGHKSERIAREHKECHALLTAMGAPAVCKNGRELTLPARMEWAYLMLRSYMIDAGGDIDPAVVAELDRIRDESKDMPSLSYSAKARQDFLLRLQAHRRGKPK